MKGLLRTGYHPGGQDAMPDPSLPPAEPPVDSTIELVMRARAGDAGALETLCERALPPLRRWARGRLPAGARGGLDTQDLVQDALVGTLRHIDRFEVRHAGALQAYLRQAVLNRIRDEARRVVRRPAAAPLDEQHPSREASPLDIAIGRQGVARYEAALARLRPADREAIIGRIELQHDYRELAAMLGKSNANAARVAVTRAIARLLEHMHDET
jgi:RNA polymerase sigma-70 factor (ECF subfamily)